MARIRFAGIVRPAVFIALWSVGGCYTALSLDGAVVDNDGTSEGETGDEELESQCIDERPSVGVGRMRLSTRYEYDNTVRDLLGDETQPASHSPPEKRSTAFENNASDHRAGKDPVRAYFDAAEDVARRVVDDRIGNLLPCDPSVDDWYATQFGRMLERMREIPEGDGTILDHTVVLWVSELATGNHSHQRMPFVTAGNIAGHFHTGRHLDFGGRSNNDMYVSIQNAFGIESQTFGDPEFCTGPLAGLTV
jgi:hypothetical protein